MVVSAGHKKVVDAINREDFSDFGDCLQMQCAKEINAGKTAAPARTKKTGGVKLTSNMTIVDMIHSLEPVCHT